MDSGRMQASPSRCERREIAIGIHETMDDLWPRSKAEPSLEFRRQFVRAAGPTLGSKPHSMKRRDKA